MSKVCLRALETVFTLTLVFLFFSRPAHAYVDAGTGSYFMQIAIGGLAGAAFSVKLFWAQIRQALPGRARDHKSPRP